MFAFAAPELTLQFFIAVFAVLFIGVSKAGFGGGLGMLTTPLAVLAFGKDAVGIVLPLLCAGDAFSLYHYWGKWEKRNLMFVLPGVIVGVVVGVQLVDLLNPRQLNIAIGCIAVAFVLFQLAKEKIFAKEGVFAPNYKIGIPCGLGAGITSSISHGAGPLIALFLIPQRMPKEIFVATTVFIFTWINWIKLPFFAIDRSMVHLPLFTKNALITPETLWISARFLLLVPVGVWLGVWMNRRFSERAFLKFVYTALLLTGLELIFQFERWF
ncbi:MAG TPA: sulfite exporter TauE/SafE family protein [Candidatus Acidoferrum sp.]|nr:sulfite exporter TauE/SafE family protein [Candidatus Acidoferrum sp.]